MVASDVLAADLHAMPQEQSQTGFMAASAWIDAALHTYRRHVVAHGQPLFGMDD